MILIIDLLRVTGFSLLMLQNCHILHIHINDLANAVK